MTCFRYDPSVPGRWREIKPSQLTKPDRGEGLDFKAQIARGYKRVEERGDRLNGRASRIKDIWRTPMPPHRSGKGAIAA